MSEKSNYTFGKKNPIDAAHATDYDGQSINDQNNGEVNNVEKDIEQQNNEIHEQPNKINEQPNNEQPNDIDFQPNNEIHMQPNEIYDQHSNENNEQLNEIDFQPNNKIHEQPNEIHDQHSNGHSGQQNNEINVQQNNIQNAKHDKDSHNSSMMYSFDSKKMDEFIKSNATINDSINAMSKSIDNMTEQMRINNNNQSEFLNILRIKFFPEEYKKMNEKK